MTKTTAKLQPIFVYVIELDGGNYYIGQTTNIKRRMRQHRGDTGSQWTNQYKPVKLIEIDLSTYISDSEAAKRESELTLQYMKIHGWEKVRGGTYCFVEEAELLYQLQMAGHFRDVRPLDRFDKRTGKLLPNFNRYYAVARGRKIGIFTAWEGLNGAFNAVNSFPGAVYKKFQSLGEAEQWFETNCAKTLGLDGQL